MNILGLIPEVAVVGGKAPIAIPSVGEIVIFRDTVDNKLKYWTSAGAVVAVTI